MNDTLVNRIADAVLYEGYLLYPYRRAVKNHQRWTFGGLYPRAFNDAWMMQTECLVRGDERTLLQVRVRFLHVVARLVGELDRPLAQCADDDEPPLRIVESLQVDDRLVQAWQEAVEREVAPGQPSLGTKSWRLEFAFPGGRRREPIRNAAGDIVGLLLRAQEAIAGTLEVSAQRVSHDLFKVCVRIENHTPFENAGTRDDALLRTLVATHTILGVEAGEFVSLLDPPEDARALAAECVNIGTWPVLVGVNEARDTMLSAPIILYDYPQIAPESPGDLFDGTEMDEMLTLRILTLTEREKQEGAALDDRARTLLQRTEALGLAQLRRLHSLGPVASEETP